MSDRNFQCVICENNFEGFGNNPYPLSEDGRCCDVCNIDVIVERFRNIVSKEGELNKSKVLEEVDYSLDHKHIVSTEIVDISTGELSYEYIKKSRNNW